MEDKLRREFYKEFANAYAGDSGLGGNYPQDPIFEINTDNPKEVADWWLSKLNDTLDTLEKEVEGLQRIGIGGAFGEGYEAGYDKAKADVVSKLKSIRDNK